MRRIDDRYTGIAAALCAAVLFGAATPLAKLLLDSVTPWLLAGALMAIGLWLHLSERHEHTHRHEEIEHDHPDATAVAPDIKHGHPHRHDAQHHSHFPDAHHRHAH